MKLGSIAAYALKGGQSHYWTDKPVEKQAAKHGPARKAAAATTKQSKAPAPKR